jgi:4-amino-4-deoxy-L-arabinose transferase-like glycosyltransferase
MKRTSSYPLWSSLVLYWLITLALLGTAITRARGHFGYPLDDTYIHMAIAKHLVNNGHWGLSAGAFSSSTSSPLWTLLIALDYRLLGVNDWAPLMLNLVCGSLVVFVCYSFLKTKMRPLTLLLVLLLVVLFVPLPVLTLSGMEHTLHGLLTLCLVYSATALLSVKEPSRGQIVLVLALSALVPITRYEGLFLILTIALLLMSSRRFSLAMLVGAAGILPVLAYGLLSLSKGWYLLPNSVLLKGNVPAASIKGAVDFLSHLPDNLGSVPHLLMILVACLFVHLWRTQDERSRRRSRSLILAFLITALLHMQFAATGWFYRYEAYLVLLGMVILGEELGLAMAHLEGRAGGVALIDVVLGATLAILMAMPLGVRAGRALRDYPLAVGNIYEQQYQMGLFVKSHYDGKGVAANDVGAISYLSDASVLDLFGLGSMDVAEAKREGRFDERTVGEWVRSHNVEIVMIYTSWLEGNIPGEWTEVGRWRIANNVACAADTVSFYAPTKSQQQDTIDNLRAFSALLPATIAQSGLYTRP